jgi:hypothetical protein
VNIREYAQIISWLRKFKSFCFLEFQPTIMFKIRGFLDFPVQNYPHLFLFVIIINPIFGFVIRPVEGVFC